MAVLDVEKLTMRFGGLTAVSQVDLAVEHGKIVSVIGPNGAGKTTVFNAITGIYEPTSGTIKLNGKVEGLPLNWWRITVWSLIGLATVIAFLIIINNIDGLWRAAIKRNLVVPGKFSYGKAWSDAMAYLHGDLALEEQRSGRWKVVTADGKKTLANVKTEE